MIELDEIMITQVQVSHSLVYSSTSPFCRNPMSVEKNSSPLTPWDLLKNASLNFLQLIANVVFFHHIYQLYASPSIVMEVCLIFSSSLSIS